MFMGLCSLTYGADDGKNTAYTKGERGVKNIALGWTEIPKTIYDTSKEKNMFVGLTFGTLKGVFNAFARTVSGSADVVSAPMGSYEKQPMKPTMVTGDK